MAPIEHPGPWWKLICKKSQKLKISCQTILKGIHIHVKSLKDYLHHLKTTLCVGFQCFNLHFFPAIWSFAHSSLTQCKLSANLR
jgi:hypothetical protein